MISFDPRTRIVIGPERAVVLSPTQTAALTALPAYPAAIPTADLIYKIWGRDPTVTKNIVHCRVIINQLRGRLADAGLLWHAIHSEYRKGYSLRA